MDSITLQNDIKLWIEDEAEMPHYLWPWYVSKLEEELSLLDEKSREIYMFFINSYNVETFVINHEILLRLFDLADLPKNHLEWYLTSLQQFYNTLTNKDLFTFFLNTYISHEDLEYEDLVNLFNFKPEDVRV